MKGYIIDKPGDIDHLKLTEVAKPAPGNDEVLVKVMGSSLNPADLKVIKGGEGAKFIHSSKTPVRPGFDFSGVVEATGSVVKHWKEGDEVFGFLPYSARTKQGSFGEYITIKADEIAGKPSKLSHPETAALATVGSTAWQSLVDIAKIRKDQKVLINGASGGVGSFAVQIARLFEAEVWGTASAENLEFVKKMGANHAIDYKTDWIDTPEQRFDIVFDVASNLKYKSYQKLLGSRGVYITLLPGVEFFKGLILNLLSGKQIKMCMVKGKTQTLEKLSSYIENDKLKVPIDDSFSLNDLQSALKKFEKAGARGKVVIEK